MQDVFRFAPSPNGYLHLGHAYSALLNQRKASYARGRLLLRMDDLDLTRCRPEYETAICEELLWLGLRWEEPVYRESEHFDAYKRALARLDAQGLIRRSYASRRDIAAAAVRATANGNTWQRDPDGAPLVPADEALIGKAELDRRRAQGEPHVLRLDMKAAVARLAGAPQWRETGHGPESENGIVSVDPCAWGDVVLARRDVPSSYHLSVVVDDAAQGVTHIVRGRDLFAATAVHRVLQELLALPAPVYYHHRLITDDKGRKLSKSAADTGLRELRAAGATPADIRRLVGLE